MSTAVAVPSNVNLSVSERIERRLKGGELTPGQVDQFRDFLREVDRELLQHRIILDNRYTHWFQKGLVNDEEPEVPLRSAV